jgi:hypothetical protein
VSTLTFLARLHTRAAAALLTTTLAALLAACGPGVGGTGTGETGGNAAIPGLDAFGAAPAPVCGGVLAEVLSCAPATTGAVALPNPAPVQLADTIDGRRVQVRLQGSTVELLAPCAGLLFSGNWGVIAGQAARYYGLAGPEGALRPATLEVQLVGSAVQLTLRDSDGRLLLGPVLVTVVASQASPGSCN